MLLALVFTGARDFAGVAYKPLRWTLTHCWIGVPHGSVLTTFDFTGGRDFAGGATEALRWTLTHCQIGVPRGSVLTMLVFTGARDFAGGATEALRWTEMFSVTRTRNVMLVCGGVSNSIAYWA